jgi:amino-acid N-acetyltransferase
MEEIKYCWAKPNDREAIQQLLQQCNLPFEDIAPHLYNYVIAKAGDLVVGVNGIEIYAQDGLLRSLAVKPAFRRRGISGELNTRVLARAHTMGLRTLYLLTQTIEDYAARSGFHKVDRQSVPETIKNTIEFKSACPETAVCMMKPI